MDQFFPILHRMTDPSPFALHRSQMTGFTRPAPRPYLEETCVVAVRVPRRDSMGVVGTGIMSLISGKYGARYWLGAARTNLP